MADPRAGRTGPLLSRLIIEIANDAYLGDELVFRGGTCLHKLYLPTALRYSEDLDYVRTTAGGIGPIIDAVRRIGESLGMRCQHPGHHAPEDPAAGPVRDR